MAPISINKDTKRSANLRVLQRIDADIIDITASATHVVLYEFNVSSQAWEKRNCEGLLHRSVVSNSVVSRTDYT